MKVQYNSLTMLVSVYARIWAYLVTCVRSELRCEVQKSILKFTSRFVNKASDWSLNKNKPLRGFVY
jgi:hypothetical protein